MTGMGGIRVEGLRKSYFHTQGGSEVVAIERLDFEVKPGELVAIAGRTGCGKSTFLNLLLGLDRPSGGGILVDGRTPYDDFVYFRGKIAGIFQQDRLLPWRTALENAKVGLEILGLPPAEQRTIAVSWLERMGLSDYLDAYPHELSGGMRQRVAMARAYAINPNLLIVDEAFGHLDEVTANALRSAFGRFTRDEHKTAIMVTHQLEEAFEVADRILVFGRPATLLADIRSGEWKGDVHRVRAAIHMAIESNQKSMGGAAPFGIVRPTGAAEGGT